MAVVRNSAAEVRVVAAAATERWLREPREQMYRDLFFDLYDEVQRHRVMQQNRILQRQQISRRRHRTTTGSRVSI